jgi:hypothetical protein
MFRSFANQGAAVKAGRNCDVIGEATSLFLRCGPSTFRERPVPRPGDAGEDSVVVQWNGRLWWAPLDGRSPKHLIEFEGPGPSAFIRMAGS